jgi:hypothetical protein
MISQSPTALKSLLVVTRKLAQSQLDGSKQFTSIKGFAHKKRRPLRKSTLLYLVVVVSSNENDGQFGPFEPDSALQVKAVHPWHTNVCNQTASRCKKISMQEIFCEGKCLHCQACGFDEALERFANPGIIVNDSDDGL